MNRFLPASLVCALLLLVGGTASAANNALGGKTFGLGVGAGPVSSGLSGKLFLGGDLALQGVVGSCGWGWGGYYYDPVTGRYFSGGRTETGLCTNIDIVAEQPQLFSRGGLGINWNYGAGVGLVAVNNAPQLSVNGILGFSLQITPVPVELTVDIRPGLSLYNGVGFFFGSGWGLRFYF